jgi:hypothetical protein
MLSAGPVKVRCPNYGFFMSRSSKKLPITGWAYAESEKRYKTAAHQAERRAARVILSATLDDSHPRLSRDYGNPAMGPKDGKTYCFSNQARVKRK